jgi:hypothetical protein
MRTLVGSLVLVFASLLLAQTPQDLRNRYGEPDMEHFRPRPNIGLTVEYGSDRLACEILIEPLQPLLHQDDQAQFMSSETVTDILEEVVPERIRGKQTLAGLHTASGCSEAVFYDYENLSIARSTNNCLPLKPERETRASVIFKRDSCRSQHK